MKRGVALRVAALAAALTGVVLTAPRQDARELAATITALSRGQVRINAVPGRLSAADVVAVIVTMVETQGESKCNTCS